MRFHFFVKGMSCAACVGHVERAAKKVLGQKDEITVSLLTNSICIITTEDAEEEKIKQMLSASLKSAGYELVEEGEIKQPNAWKNGILKFVISLIFTLAVTYLSMGKMLGLPLPAFLYENPLLSALLQFSLCIPVIGINFKFFRNGGGALLHLSPNMDSLIALGAGASLLYGIIAIVAIAVFGNKEWGHVLLHDLYFESAAMILTLVSLGKLLEGNAKEKAANAVKALSAITPRYATVLRDGVEVYVDIHEIAEGECVLVRAGEMIPVDGVVTDGHGCTDESVLTGESMPVDKTEGCSVCAASVLLDGFLRIRATGVGEDTSLSRMVRLLEDAAASKAPIARLADKVSAVFVPVVMGISLCTFTVWMIVTGNIEMSFRSAISVLVISCPCALGLATPTAITVGIGRGARIGILFKSAEALESLSRCKSIVFDKTGTLTEGKPVLTDIYVYGQEINEVLTAAASLERRSSHPLALAIVTGAVNLGVRENEEVEDFQSLVGIGCVGRIGAEEWSIGRPEESLDGDQNTAEDVFVKTEHEIFIKKQKRAIGIGSDLKKLWDDGKTAVVLKRNGTVAAILGISDRIREDAQGAVEVLSRASVSSLMLTGDHERVAARVAKQLALKSYFASLMPSDKERIVKQLSKAGDCAMVGDGINDAPALLAATVGIAVGAGTEIAIDCADVVISNSSPMGICDAYMLSRASIRIIKQNLFWALFYNAACIPIAAGAFYPLIGLQLTPMLASLAMSCSSVFVVLNALRLRYVRLYKGELEQTNVYTLSVEGMMCHRCTSSVQRALEGVRGVKDVQVELSSGRARIKASVKDARPLLQAVRRAGYCAREIKK